MTDLRELAEQVLDRCVAGPGNCLIWTGCANSGGYGQKWIGGTKKEGTHRIVYKRFKGDIPNGLVLDHLCRNPRCCNPNHLEAVTTAENTRRGFAGAKTKQRAIQNTHCKHGHKKTAANRYVAKNGKSMCRDCARLRQAVRYATNVAAGLTIRGKVKTRFSSRVAKTPEQLIAGALQLLPDVEVSNHEHS